MTNEDLLNWCTNHPSCPIHECCDLCMYEKGRTDAIDLIDRHLWNYSHEVWEDFKPILEQLKGRRMTEFNFDTSYYFSSLDNLNKECKNYTNSESKYKELRLKYENEIYNKALDDLARIVCKYYTLQQRAGYCADTNNMIKQRTCDFAEQLKKGKEE